LKYFLALGLFAAVPAYAQAPAERIEISPFIGYMFAGSFSRVPPNFAISEINVSDHFDFGVSVGFNLTNAIEPEFRWTRANTEMVFEGVPGGTSGTPPRPLTMDYFLAGASYNFSSGKIRPYVSVDVGAARLANIRVDDPLTQGGPKPSTDFAASVGVGVKAFITPNFGLRFDARGYASSVPDHFFFTCFTTPDANGVFYETSCGNKWLFNGDVTAGIVVAF
jgi:hypothetical protein